MRGGDAADDAVCRSEDPGAAERNDASPGPPHAQPAAHSAVERDAGTYVGVRDRGAGGAHWARAPAGDSRRQR